jgi:hypothetical protein
LSHFSSPHEQLTATVSSGPLILPPSVTDSGEILRNAANIKALLAVLAPEEADSNAKMEARQKAFEISNYLNDLALKEPAAYRYFSGFIQVDIKNNGQLSAEKVTIRLPGAREAVVIHEDKVTPVPIDSSIVHIGSIGPKETIKVIGWTLTPLFDLDQVIVADNHGLASVVELKPRPPLPAQILEMWPLLLFFSLLTLLIVARILATTTERKVAPEIATEDSSPPKLE